MIDLFSPESQTFSDLSPSQWEILQAMSESNRRDRLWSNIFSWSLTLGRKGARDEQ